MMKLLVTLLVAAFAAVSTLPVTAADDKPAEKKEAPARAIPFRGKIASVDKHAKSLSEKVRLT